MIKNFKSEFSGFSKALPVAPEATREVNWVTVFIAENGGRKSFLLRLLPEAALGRRYFRPTKGIHILLGEMEIPRRVIAISGTPLDRFPRTGTRDLKTRRRTSSYEDNFVYLGQRASNGMSGVAQSERSFVGSLMSNRHQLKERAAPITTVFRHLGLQPYVSVKLRVSDTYDPQQKLSETKAAERIRYSLEFEEGPAAAKELRQAFDQLRVMSTELRISRVLKLLTKPKTAFTITPESIRPLQGLSVAMWELLLRLGVVEVFGTTFRRISTSSDNSLLGEELSSGQWNWLGTFGSLIAELRDDSLILVDEPENSLHPRWQREFMPELYSVMRGFQGCQVIVATHSPLIASSVSPSWGNIRTLKRAARVDAVVRSEPLTTTFGWNASDVYDELFAMETTRAPGFLRTADHALQRINNGDEISRADRELWIRELLEDIETLPAFDPLRDVIAGIVATLDQQKTGGGRNRK